MVIAVLLTLSLTDGSKVKALIAICIGFLIALIGLDPVSSVNRFTFGSLELSDGIDIALIVMALFAIPEAVRNLAVHMTAPEKSALVVQGGVWMSREDWKHSSGPFVRGSFIGFLCGLIPGLGPTLGAFASYLTEKNFAARKGRPFGSGRIEGVAGPEAANNAAVGGAMVPMLTLGIPGSATTALLLFVFIMYGLQPGPTLMTENAGLVWTIIAAMYIGNVMLLILNLPLVKVFIQLLKIPPTLLYASVLSFVVVGAYALSFNFLSLLFLFAIGLLGLAMEHYDIPFDSHSPRRCAGSAAGKESAPSPPTVRRELADLLSAAHQHCAVGSAGSRPGDDSGAAKARHVHRGVGRPPHPFRHGGVTTSPTASEDFEHSGSRFWPANQQRRTGGSGRPDNSAAMARKRQ